MAQSNEEHSVKELERGDVDQLSMEDLSQESNMQNISSTQWETLYQESQSKLDIILETLAPVVSRLKILEGKQSAVELQQPFEKTQIVKSEYSANTKYYKDGWCAKIKWNEKESFRDFVDKLELEYSAVRPKELYWLQLNGDALFSDMSSAQQEMYYERSRDMLLSLKTCLAGTVAMPFIRHVKVNKNQEVTGAELAWRLLSNAPVLWGHNAQLRNMIVTLEMPAGYSLKWYIDLGIQLEKDMVASPVMELEDMINHWLEGLLPKFDRAKFPARNEMYRLVRDGDVWCFHDVAGIVRRETTKFGEFSEGQGYFVNGQDVSKICRKQVVQAPLIQGSRTNATDTRVEFKCTNSHCDTPNSHSTDYCASYGGAKEGMYSPNWPQEYKTKLKKKLTEMIAKHGPSKNTATQAVGSNATDVETSIDDRLQRMRADMLYCAEKSPDKTMGVMNDTCAEMNKASAASAEKQETADEFQY